MLFYCQFCRIPFRVISMLGIGFYNAIQALLTVRKYVTICKVFLAEEQE
jgi:hypothetical protein